MSCCPDLSHCIHRLLPDSASKLLEDLQRLHQFVKSRLSSFPRCQVIPAGDLLTGSTGASHKVILAAYAGWGAVHGSAAAYTRMALSLVDLLNNDGKFSQLPTSSKLTRSASSASSSTSQGQGIPVIGPPPCWTSFKTPSNGNFGSRGRGRGGGPGRGFTNY
jgi:hypothetical protein